MINNSQKQTGSAHIVIITILTIFVIGLLGFVFWQNFINTPSVETQVTTQEVDEETPTDGAVKDVAIANGTISGKAIYPSEAYPDGFKVCVVTKVTREEVVCDTSFPGNKYSVEVSPGEYYVVAKAPPPLEGYYDGYMKTGMTGDICMDDMHTPLLVTVASGATLNDIDAGNFYYLAENC